MIRKLLYIYIIYTIIIISNSSIIFNFPYSISLSNGNILIIHKYGITICDGLLSNIIEDIVIFNKDEEIKTELSLSKVTTANIDEYIISIINDKIYIFNDNGNLLYEDDKKILEQEESADYYTLVPIKKEGNYIFYFIGFIHNASLYFLYYEYDYIEKTNFQLSKRIGKHEYNLIKYDIKNKGLSCQYMTYNENINFLICFYLVANYDLTFDYFSINTNKTIAYHSYFKAVHYNYPEIKCIKSCLVAQDHSKALVGLYLINGEYQYFIFDANYNSQIKKFYLKETLCRNQYYGLKINYYKEKEEYIYSCLFDNSTILISMFNKELKNYKYTFKYTDCDKIYGYSIIYSIIKEKYFIISDENCKWKNYPINLLYNEMKEEENYEENQNEEENYEKNSKKKEENSEKKENIKDLFFRKLQINDEENIIEEEIYENENIQEYKYIDNDEENKYGDKIYYKEKKNVNKGNIGKSKYEEEIYDKNDYNEEQSYEEKEIYDKNDYKEEKFYEEKEIYDKNDYNEEQSYEVKEIYDKNDYNEEQSYEEKEIYDKNDYKEEKFYEVKEIYDKNDYNEEQSYEEKEIYDKNDYKEEQSYEEKEIYNKNDYKEEKFYEEKEIYDKNDYNEEQSYELKEIYDKNDYNEEQSYEEKEIYDKNGYKEEKFYEVKEIYDKNDYNEEQFYEEKEIYDKNDYKEENFYEEKEIYDKNDYKEENFYEEKEIYNKNDYNEEQSYEEKEIYDKNDYKDEKFYEVKEIYNKNDYNEEQFYEEKEIYNKNDYNEEQSYEEKEIYDKNDYKEEQSYEVKEIYDKNDYKDEKLYEVKEIYDKNDYNEEQSYEEKEIIKKKYNERNKYEEEIYEEEYYEEENYEEYKNAKKENNEKGIIITEKMEQNEEEEEEELFENIKYEFCLNQKRKYIPIKNKCINNCFEDNYFNFEFKNICYHECPHNTKPSINDICEIDCDSIKLFNNLCLFNQTNFKSKEELIDNILENIKNRNLISNESKVIKIDNTLFHIAPLDRQKNNDSIISTIYLDECEKSLRESDYIHENESLFIFKIDVYIEDYIFPVVEYMIFNYETGEKINLDICKGLKAELSLPIIIKEDNLDKYDSSSGYYNDICYTYKSLNGVDVCLKDRKNEYIENKLALCEVDCTLKEIDIINQKSLCNCNIKYNFFKISEIVIDKYRLYNNFDNLDNIANIKVMKCYHILFTKEGLLFNIGFFIIIPIIILRLIIIIIFYKRDFPKIKLLIIEIVKMKKYLNNKEIHENPESKIEIKKNNDFKKEILKENPNKTNLKRRSIKNKKKIIENEESYEKIKNDIKGKIESLSFPPIRKNNRNKNPSNNILKMSGNDLSDKSLKKFERSSFEINPVINQKENKADLNLNMNILKYNNLELNICNYEEALKFDKRSYTEYYISLLLTNHLLLFPFLKNDYNSFIIKLDFFFFSFVLHYTVNAFFFNDDTMHKIYEDGGSFNFSYQIPQIIYSSLISIFVIKILKELLLSEKNILKLKKEKNLEHLDKKSNDILKCLSLKFIIYFIISSILLLFCWYYLCCFCAVYKNTQIHLIKDAVISFSLSLIYPLIFYLIPGIFRIPSLKSKNSQCIYNLSKIIQMIL